MCFRIRAYNSAGNSRWDPSVSPYYVCATTPALQPIPNPTYAPAPLYAGYSAHPSQGAVSFAQANWTIPFVTCKHSSAPKYEAQVSVWAGLWGGPNTATGIANAWLPQVGTISDCITAYGVPYSTTYLAFAEIYNASHPKGTGVIPLPSINANAGDQMYAHIEYIGLGTGSHAGELRFWYYIGDLTTSSSASGYLYTTITGVSLVHAAYQGGVIVEKVQQGNGISGDLPRFPAINIKNVYVGQNPANPNTTWTDYQWNLKDFTTGKVYATTGPVSNFPVPPGQGSWSVNWANY